MIAFVDASSAEKILYFQNKKTIEMMKDSCEIFKNNTNLQSIFNARVDILSYIDNGVATFSTFSMKERNY